MRIWILLLALGCGGRASSEPDAVTGWCCGEVCGLWADELGDGKDCLCGDVLPAGPPPHDECRAQDGPLSLTSGK